MVVSDGLRSTLVWSKFKKKSLDVNAVCYTGAKKKKKARCARRMVASNPLYVFPHLLQSLDPPLGTSPTPST